MISKKVGMVYCYVTRILVLQQRHPKGSLLLPMRIVITDKKTKKTWSFWFLFELFSPESEAKICQQISCLKNLEKHYVVAPLVHTVVLSSLATKPNQNSSWVNLSPLCPPLCLYLQPKKCCAFVVSLCKQAVWELGESKQVATKALLSWALKKARTWRRVIAQLHGPTLPWINRWLVWVVEFQASMTTGGPALGFQWGVDWWALAAGCS